MVEFIKNEHGVWEEHGSLPPGCHLVNLQYLVAGRWEPPIGSMAALQPSRVRELMNDPSGPKPKESYRMIPITVNIEETDMKAKKTKAPKITKAGRERGLAAIAKEKAAAKTPKAAKPATSDTSKAKSAAEPELAQGWWAVVPNDRVRPEAERRVLCCQVRPIPGDHPKQHRLLPRPPCRCASPGHLPCPTYQCTGGSSRGAAHIPPDS